MDSGVRRSDGTRNFLRVHQGLINPAGRDQTDCRFIFGLDSEAGRSSTSEQIGQGFFDDGILVLITAMNLFNKGFIYDPTKTQLVKKDDLFTVHICVASFEHGYRPQTFGALG
jgi:hypothetical protein